MKASVARKFARCIIPLTVMVCCFASVWLANFKPMPPGQPLIRAVKAGDEKLVRRLLAQGMDPNTEDAEPPRHEDRSGLWGSAQHIAQPTLPEAALAVLLDVDRNFTPAGKPKPDPIGIVSALLEHNANPRARCADGDTLIMRAASFGFHRTVRALIARGGSVQDRLENGTNAMQGAIGSGDLETVKALVEGGWKVNALEVRTAGGAVSTYLAKVMERDRVSGQPGINPRGTNSALRR